MDPEASRFDLLVEMCLEQEGAFLSALCSSGAVGGSVGHCNQQLEERPFQGEKKTEWRKEFSPAFQMFLVGGGVIVVEIDNRLLIGHWDFTVTKVFTNVWALCEGGHGSSDKRVYL